MRWVWRYACLAATLVVWVVPSMAQDATTGPGTGRRLYDTGTVETVRGEVVRVEQTQGRAGGRGGGVHASLKTDTGEIPVHLGPVWYLKEQPVQIEVKDRIEVRGSRVTVGDQPALIAAEVTKGDQILRLRRADGVPLWSGRGPGRRSD